MSNFKPIFNFKSKGSLVLHNVQIESNITIDFFPRDSIFIEYHDITINGRDIHFHSFNNPTQDFFSIKKCIFCDHPANGTYVYPCFHKPYCRSCFTLFSINDGCPLCGLGQQFTIESEIIDQQKECRCSKCPTSIIIHCYHLLCYEYIDKLTQRKQYICPVRGTKIDSIKILPPYDLNRYE
jgi:hypothetical protein